MYHSLVDSLPINVIRKSLRGQLTFANRTYCELIGRPLNELVGLTDYDLFPAQLAEKYVRDDEHVAATGDVFHDIEKNVTDGKARYFEVYKVPVYGGDSRIAETQAIFWDVTERVETREALARERDLLQTLMDSLPDLVYVKDRESRFVMGNRAQLRVANVERPELFERTTAHDYFPEEIADGYVAEDREVMRTGEPMLDREEHWIDREGRPRWYLSSKVPLRDRDGSTLGIVGIDREITNRKLMEEELRRSNRELDQFVSVVTHDLQAPLRVVASYGKLLGDSLSTSENAEVADYLAEMRSGLARMQRLIDSLRSYARLTEKQQPKRPTDLNLVVQQALANLEVVIREHQASVTVVESLPTVWGDGVQLMQLFQNLVANAVKYCRDRQPVVTIDCLERGDEWQVSIADNGIGIAADRIPDIFRIFQRLHEDEREFEGTGIGLAVCKRIVDRHQGRIWVESVVGQGSIVHFMLPKNPVGEDVGVDQK
ncbi:MAG: PAS domain-containing protein [Planctomycetaceae bacterium]